MSLFRGERDLRSTRQCHQRIPLFQSFNPWMAIDQLMDSFPPKTNQPWDYSLLLSRRTQLSISWSKLKRSEMCCPDPFQSPEFNAVVFCGCNRCPCQIDQLPGHPLTDWSIVTGQFFRSDEKMVREFQKESIFRYVLLGEEGANSILNPKQHQFIGYLPGHVTVLRPFLFYLSYHVHFILHYFSFVHFFFD